MGNEMIWLRKFKENRFSVEELYDSSRNIYYCKGRHYCPACGAHIWFRDNNTVAFFEYLKKVGTLNENAEYQISSLEQIHDLAVKYGHTGTNNRSFINGNDLVVKLEKDIAEKYKFDYDLVFAEENYRNGGLFILNYSFIINGNFEEHSFMTIGNTGNYKIMARYKINEAFAGDCFAPKENEGICPICGNTEIIRELYDKRAKENPYYTKWVECEDGNLERVTFPDEEYDIGFIASEKERIINKLNPGSIDALTKKPELDDIKLFLSHFLNVECGILFYEDALENLLKHKVENDRKILYLEKTLKKKVNEPYNEKKNELLKEKEGLKDKYVLDDSLQNIDSWIAKHVFVPVSPTQPIKPQLVKPEEPQMKKSNLFNRKKVEEEYADEHRKYEAELEAYNRENEDYRKAMEEYNSQVGLYNQQMERFYENRNKAEAEFNLARKEAEEKLEEEYKNKLKSIDTELLDIDKVLNELENNPKKVIAGTPEYEQHVFIKSELESICDNLKAMMGCKNQMISSNLIIEKYCNLVAISSIYEYFLTGRCNDLEGPDGAYNLYEREKLGKEIVSKLDDVLASLEKIKENQGALYSKMCEIQTSLSSLETTMNEGFSILSRQSSESLNYLKDIKENTRSEVEILSEINTNTAISAYYNMKTAEYAKRTAELTNAIAFMKAIWG